MTLSNHLRDYLMILTKLHLRPITLAMKGITDSAIRRVMAEAKDDYSVDFIKKSMRVFAEGESNKLYLPAP